MDGWDYELLYKLIPYDLCPILPHKTCWFALIHKELSSRDGCSICNTTLVKEKKK